MIVAPVLNFNEMALRNYDQDFSPADDIFSYWYGLDCHPEPYASFPHDVTAVCIAAAPLAQGGVDSVGAPINGPTDQWSSSGSSPFRQSGGFCFRETSPSTEYTENQDPKTSATQHTSLCGIEPQVTAYIPACSAKMTSLSPSVLNTEPSCSDSVGIETTIKLAPRKRGRPRINRNRTISLSSSSDASSTPTSVHRPGCLPHKQVERKYREGLNLQLERLRKAVPTLLQSTDSCVMGAAKPSKGMVLAAAIKYISKIEQERDSAIDEVERLGGNIRVGKLMR
jgi:hypothetical protein